MSTINSSNSQHLVQKKEDSLDFEFCYFLKKSYVCQKEIIKHSCSKSPCTENLGVGSNALLPLLVKKNINQ